MSTRVALVTGGSSGIGAETATGLVAAGFEVYAVARRVDQMADLEPAGVHTFAVDGHRRRLDGRRCGAGAGRAGPDRRAGQLRRLRLLRRRGRRADRRGAAAVRGQRLRAGPADPAGHSADARAEERPDHQHLLDRRQVLQPLGAWYHATKFAGEGLSDSLRLELAPFGIDVVIIEPGPIRTEWNTISRDSLVERSRGGAYEERATRMRATMERADGPLMSSPPSTVARKIVKAAVVNTPRARYPVGRGAGTIVRARKVLPDVGMDLLIRSMYR